MKAEMRSRTKLLSAAVAAIVFLFVQEAVSQAEEITAIRKELQSEVQAGRYEQAVKVSERLIAKLEATYPEPNEQHAAAYTDHGMIQQSMGQHASSITTLRKAMELASVVPSVKIERRLEIMRLLASGYDRSGDSKSARDAYLKAVDFADKHGLGKSAEAFQAIVGIANAFARENNFDEAHGYYLKALRLSFSLFEIGSEGRNRLSISRLCLVPKNSRNRRLLEEYDALAKELSENENKEKNVVHGKAISLGRPSYPSAALNDRRTGTVYVSVSVDEKGNVKDAVAVCSPRPFWKVSEDAALRSKFEPTTVNGIPIPVKGVLTFNFLVQ